MEGSVMDLSGYRLEKAKEDLETAEENLAGGKFRASVNRSYYAVFHALRAITALDHFDSGKHSGIIAFFNQHYVKTSVFDKEISKMIDSCYRLREKADYDDFFLVAKDDALQQLDTVTHSGNQFWGPDGMYTRSGNVVHGPNGQIWNGVNSDDDVFGIISHNLK